MSVFIRYLICFLILGVMGNSIMGQEDSNQKDSLILEHSPKKATLLSVALPGAGQVYNKKYWKLPIIYGGAAASIYFIRENTRQARFFTQNLINATDTLDSTVNMTNFSATDLSTIREQYLKWRDISWFCLAGVYLLQILDANVDAHLFYFDVSPEVSLSWQPQPVLGKPGIGLYLEFGK